VRFDRGALVDQSGRKDMTMSKPNTKSAATQQELAEKALKLKQENTPEEVPYPTDQTPDHGMNRIEHTDQASSGAFDDVGDKPARERSRERR